MDFKKAVETLLELACCLGTNSSEGGEEVHTSYPERIRES
jgi:hypothetical protein